ncbi:MAG: hypothetical protein JWO10_1651 [Microbacteriaceae bacterium]|nr:hypothetical protein [Microbacteriaceae bacterium]
MAMGKLKTTLLVLAATVALAGCTANPGSGSKSAADETAPSASAAPSESAPAAAAPSVAPQVASNLPAGIRTDGFYKQNSASGYNKLFQFNDDGTVSGLFTVVSASDLAENKPGTGKLRKYWLNSRASSQTGSPQYGPNVPGVTQKPLETDGTVGYRDSQGPVTYKILDISTNTIRISETYGGGVLTSDWTFTAY